MSAERTPAAGAASRRTCQTGHHAGAERHHWGRYWEPEPEQPAGPGTHIRIHFVYHYSVAIPVCPNISDYSVVPFSFDIILKTIDYYHVRLAKHQHTTFDAVLLFQIESKNHTNTHRHT